MGDSEGLRVEATKLTLEIKQFIKRERIARPGSMQDTGSLGLVHWDDPEGWYEEGGGGGRFRIENTCTPMADSC